ncbi:hypothetical protein [Vibrio ordalii]|uniref:hypothetical protein n=1 Tax=Vibrio ordalii TaxID=28174 RepID=UPI000310E4B2
MTSSLKFKTIFQPASQALSSLIAVPNAGINVSTNPWIEEGGWLRSAPMADAEQSVLQLENVPQGKLHFDFQVSSASRDLFIAKVNGVEYIMESGEESGRKTLYLNEDFNNIRFEYIKKSNEVSGTDAAYIKNLKYEKPYSSTLPPLPPLSGDSGGGSTGGMTLLSMLAALLIRRRYMSH